MDSASNCDENILPEFKLMTEASIGEGDCPSVDNIIYLEATNSYLLLSKGSSVRSMDEDGNIDTEPDISFQDDVKMCYNQNYGSIVSITATDIAIRRNQDGFYAISTMFSKTDKHGQITIEIPMSEAISWNTHFNAMNDALMLQDNINLADFSAKVNENLTKRKNSVVVSVNGLGLFNDLMLLTNKAAVENYNFYPVFPYAYFLMERLRLILFPSNPYGVQRRISSPGSHDFGVDKNCLNVEAARRETFGRWKHMNYKYAIPPYMAEAGFYHHPNGISGYSDPKCSDDRVLCFNCNVCLVSWEPDDVPRQEHERHSTACPFILGRNYKNSNVPLDITMANLTSFNWSTHADIGRKISLDELVVSSMTADSQWFSVAIRDGASKNSPIVVFNLDVVSQVPYTFMINPFDPFVADKLGLSTKNEITWSDSGSDDQSQNNEAPVPTIVTALCCVGGKPLCSNSNPTPLPSLSPFSVNSMSKISGALFIGVGVIDAIASHVKKAPLVATDSTESLSDVSVLNRVNDSMISDTCPRIAEQSASNELRRRPFIFVYHIAESISATDIEQPPFKFIDTDDELDQIFVEGKQMLDEMQPAFDYSDATKSQNNSAAGGIETGHESLVSRSVNSDQEIPGTRRDISTIIMQCIQLPAGLDSPDKEITSIISSDSVVFVAVNRLCGSGDLSSTLVVYPRIELISMLHQSQAQSFSFNFGKLEQILMLSNDYLVYSSSATETTDKMTDAKKASKTTIVGYVVLRFSNGVLLLLDLKSGKNQRICFEKHIVDVTMGPQAILTALGKDGSISFLELKQVLPQIPHDADEELAISALSVVEEISEDFNAQIGKISHPVIQASLDDIHRTINSCIVSKGISSDSLQEIWRLTRSEFFSKDIATSITGAMNDSIFSMKDPRQHCLKNIKNLSSSIVHLHQTAFGVQMNAPSHWTEVPAKQKQTTTFISSNHLAGYKSMLSAPIDFSSDSANLTNTRTWTLSPGETEFAFPAYVFEFTVVPSMPLNSISCCIRYKEGSKAPPDGTFSLYYCKNDKFLANINDKAVHLLPSHSIQTQLMRMSQDPSILTNNAKQVYGPVKFDRFSDVSERFSIIHINQNLLLNIIGASSLENNSYSPDWINKPHRFFILFESTSTLSPQQLAYRRIKTMCRSMHGTESGLKRSHECSKNQKDDTTIFSPTPTGDSLIAPSQSYTQKKREKKTIPLTYKSIKKSNAGSSFSKIPYHRRPTFGTAKDEQTSSKDGEFNGASGLQWIEEFSVSFYRTEPNRIQRNKLERVLLLYTPMNFERIFDILLQNETGSFKSNSTKLAHCQALDILNWLIAELTSLLSTSNSQKFKTLVNKLYMCVSNKISSIIENGFVNSERTMSQKWAVFLIDLFTNPAFVKNVDSSTLCTCYLAIFSSLAEYTDKLFVFHKNGSLHWFSIFALSIIKAIIFDDVPDPLIDIEATVKPFLAKCLEVLDVVGGEWKHKWVNSVNKDLSRECKLSGIVVDQNLFECPSQIILLKAVVDCESSLAKRESRSELKGHTKKPYLSYQPYSFTDSFSDFGDDLMADYFGQPLGPEQIPSLPPGASISQSSHQPPLYTFYAQQPFHAAFEPGLCTFALPMQPMPSMMPPPPIFNLPCPHPSIYAAGYPLPPISMTSKAPQANASDNSASIMNRFGGIVTGGDNNEFNSEIMSQYGLTSVISGSFCSEMMDVLSWQEFLQLNDIGPSNVGEKNCSATQSSSQQPPPGFGSGSGWGSSHATSAAKVDSGNKWDSSYNPYYNAKINMDMNSQSSASQAQRLTGISYNPASSQRIALNMHGLFEAEPLNYIVLYGTDHMSILGSKGKEPVASETVATYGTKRDLNGPSSILEATSQRLKNLNTIFSITSAKSDGGEKKSNTLTPSEEKETHQSSASTFGIPTTPKTTPFLTPNPLSPKNSQSDLTEVAGESQLTFEEMLIDKVEDHNMQADVPDIMEKSTTSKISRTLFQSQQPPTLSVERMTAGSKKFVVLDLLSPVLITDLIFPSCEYCNYITIDSWLQDENRESVRILSSDEISHKSIIVNSMNPPVLAQYIRITYTVNQFQKKTCRSSMKAEDFVGNISLGKIFGTRFFSEYQTYSCHNKSLLKTGLNEGAFEFSLPQFIRLYELVQTEHAKISRALTESVRNGCSEIKNLYQEAQILQLELNHIRSLIQRFYPKFFSEENLNWHSCCNNKLECISTTLFSFVFNIMFLLDVRSKISSLLQHPAPIFYSRSLTLDTTIQYFDHFCVDSLPILRVQCCALLFQMGVQEEWWSDLFPTLLKKYFSTTANKSKHDLNDLFLFLSYLCGESVKYPCLQTQVQVIEKLFEFVIILADEIKAADEGNVDIDISSTKALLSWTLMLISSSFDVIVSRRRRTNRWTFLCGEPSFLSEKLDQQNPTSLSRYGSKKPYVGASKPAHSTFSVPPPPPMHPPPHPFLQNILQNKNILPSKNYYKKLSDQVEKMKQNQAISQAKIDKLKNRLQSLQFAYATAVKGANQSSGIPPSIQSLQSDQLANQQGAPVPAEYSASISGNLRQYGIKLKLSSKLCVDTVQKLSEILCRPGHNLLPLHTKLLIFKVIANTCVHGIQQTIPLSVALDHKKIESMISMASDNDQSDHWLRHAILCLFLDLSESEVRAMNKDMLAEQCSSRREFRRHASVDNSDLQGPSNSLTDAKLGEAKKPKKNEKGLLSAEASSSKVESSSSMDTENEGAFYDDVVLSTMMEATSTAASNLSDADSLQLETLKAQFYIECQMSSSDCTIQPSAATIGHLAEPTNVHNLFVRCAKNARLQEHITRFYIRRLSILPCKNVTLLPKQNSVAEENGELIRTMNQQVGTCFITIMDAVHSLFASLDPSKVKPAFVHHLFYMYWSYQTNFTAFLNTKSNNLAAKSNQFSVPILSNEAVRAILSFSANYSYMDEQLWTDFFKILNLSFQKKPALIEELFQLKCLKQLLENLIGSDNSHSCSEVNIPTMGPSINHKMEQFLELIMINSPRNAIEEFISISISLLTKDSTTESSPRRTEVLLNISKILALNTPVFAKTINIDQVAELYNELQSRSFQAILLFVNQQENGTTSRDAIKASQESWYCSGNFYGGTETPCPINICLSNNSEQISPSASHKQLSQEDPLEYVALQPHTSFTNDYAYDAANISKKQSKHIKSLKQKIIDQVSFNQFDDAPQGDTIYGPFEVGSMELDHGDVPFDDIYYDDSPTYNDYPSFYSPQQQSYHSFVPSSCLLPRGSQKAKFITHSTKQETVLCNFLKMIGILLRDATSPCSNENDGLANILLRKHPETLRNTLNTLFYCELSTKKPIDAISIESWKCVSLADTILYSLLTMLSSVKNNVDASKQLLEHLINIIRHRDENVLTSLQHNPSYHISTCVVFLLLQMIVNQKYSTAFIELDGHLLVAKQLQQLILTTFENIQTTWTTDASFTALQHQLNSITDRILGIGGNNQPESSVSASNKPQTTTEQQQKWAPSSAVEESDQFQNYAPKCTITSSSPVAQHMPVLLSANASQRRSRTPQWTYNFLPGQEWLDISLTLPHPVMLKEIVVKPHLSALIGCPSAVQAEVQADPLGLHWSAIQCPQHTLGRSVVRISAAHYKNPIKSVRLFLRKPLESSTMGLMQIILNGTTMLSEEPTKFAARQNSKYLIYWLTIFNQLTSLNTATIWSYAPKLPHLLTQLFLENPDPKNENLNFLLNRVLVKIDVETIGPSTDGSTQSIIHLMIKHIVDGGFVPKSQHSSMAELIYTLTTVDSKNHEPNQITDEIISMIDARQHQFLTGLLKLFEHEDQQVTSRIAEKGTQDRQEVLVLLLWVASCTLWKNFDTDLMRAKTIATCCNFAPAMLKPLVKLSLLGSNAENEEVKKRTKTAACWVLCAYIRAAPEFAQDLFLLYAQDNPLYEPSRRINVEQEFSPSVLWALSRVCQSSVAVNELKSSGRLKYWIQQASYHCQSILSQGASSSPNSFDELVSIVELFEHLCSVPDICIFLEEPDCVQFLQQLLEFIIEVSGNKSSPLSKYTNIKLTRIQNSTIYLLKSCLSSSEKHRINVASNLCSLMQRSHDAELNASLMSMVQQLVLEDERIACLIVGVKSTVNVCNQRQLMQLMPHPVFGCRQHDFLIDLPMHTPFKELCQPLVGDTSKIETDDKPEEIKPFLPSSYNYSGSHSIKSWYGTPGYNKYLKRKARRPGQETKDNSNNQSALGLYCSSESKPLAGDWSLATVISKNRCSSSDYAFVKLSIGSRCPDKFSYADAIENVPISTLEHFASIGGLLELSKRYYIYHHALTKLFNSCNSLSQDLTRISKEAELGLSKPSATISQHQMAAYAYSQFYDEYDYADEFLPTTTPTPSYPATTGGGAGFDTNSQGTITATSSTPVSNTFAGVAKTSTPVPNTSGFSFGSSALRGPSPSASRLPYNSLHIIPLFGLFLRLDSYAQLMIQTDRLKAKKLLCLALDIKPIERTMSEFIASLQPVKKEYFEESPKPKKSEVTEIASIYRNLSQNSRDTSVDGEVDDLLLFPLQVLTKLYENFSPENVEMAVALSVRQTSIDLGIVDALLICMNHFAHNDCSMLRPTNETHSETTVSLIAEVLKANERLEQLRDSINQMQQFRAEHDPLGVDMPIPVTSVSANTVPTFSTGGFSHPTSSAFNAPKTTATTQTSATGSAASQYWAKGTGYGSGSTAAQWNVHEHLSKRRMDENHLANLLNVFTAFIMPPPAKPVPRDESPLLMLLDEGELMPSTSSQANATSPSKDGTPKEHGPIELSEEFVQLLYRASIYKILQSYLANDSVLDISKHVNVFDAVIAFISVIAQTPNVEVNIAKFVQSSDQQQLDDQRVTIDVLGTLLTDRNDLFNQVVSGHADYQETMKSISHLLEKLKGLHTNIELYLNKVKKSKPAPSQTAGSKKKQRKIQFELPGEVLPIISENEDPTGSAIIAKGNTLAEEEEGLDKTLNFIIDACTAIERKLEKRDVDNLLVVQPGTSVFTALADLINSREKVYCDAMKHQQFETITFYDSKVANLVVPYHYSTSLSSSGQVGSAKRTRRLAQEIVSLNSSLPLSLSSSVFVRASEERLDAMKVLITGPSETPYSNGCFEFDIFFPSDYPNSPMLVNLETTGNRSVRFNPNLYDDGKVCLSILNTWRGRPEERWSPDTSSLLQVIVSIQSLILVSDPYFNEPGYERWRNTPAGISASREYDANIRQMNVRWAIIETLKHPSKPFEAVIKRHFWLKRDEICEQIEGWIEEMQGHIKSGNSNKVTTGKTLPAYLTGLKKQYDMLKEEFAKLQCPEGLESLCVSTRYPTASSNCTASKDVEVMDSSVACTKTDSSVDKDSAPTQKETDANDLPVENKDEDDHQEAFILS